MSFSWCQGKSLFQMENTKRFSDPCSLTYSVWFSNIRRPYFFRMYERAPWKLLTFYDTKISENTTIQKICMHISWKYCTHYEGSVALL